MGLTIEADDIEVVVTLPDGAEHLIKCAGIQSRDGYLFVSQSRQHHLEMVEVVVAGYAPGMWRCFRVKDID